MSIDNLVWCTTFYEGSAQIPSGMTSGMSCASNGKRDICQDDFDPLQIVHPVNSNFFRRIGITSFGLSSGMSPNIYTRVSYYLPGSKRKSG